MTTPSQSPEPSGEPGSGRSLFSVDADQDAICSVCREPVESGASALCSECGEPYHLVLTNDAEGKNCGEVWLNEEFLALEFGCTRCLAALRADPSAAPDASVPPATEAASGDESPSESGRVRHAGSSAREIVRRKRR